MHIALLALFLFALALPPAVKVVTVIGLVYGVMVAVKKAWPALSGWKAIVLNVLLSVTGYFATVGFDPGAFYTLGTLQMVVIIIIQALGAAGIQGTVKALSQPTVLATTEDGKTKNVPATIQPINPTDTKIEDKR